MKKILLGAVVLGSLVSASAFAQNEQVYYPNNRPVVQGQSSVTRAQVKAQLVQAEKSGEIKRLDRTVYFGN